MRAPLPVDEPDRLHALHVLDILDTGPESDFDDVVRLAAAICGTPESQVSLIDADRQWFKANTVEGPTETPRDESFCAHAILGRGLLVVPDARTDDRFADNPHVRTEPGVRFYAGAPLVTTDGFALGTLCVLDAVPRRLSLAQLRALRALARQVTAQLELRRFAQAVQRDAAHRHEVERVQDRIGPLAGGRLREPLAELRRCAEVLRDLDYCPPELATLMGAAVHASAPELVRMLDDLLLLGGSDPGLFRQEIDLNPLVDWAVREMAPIAEAKDIAVRLSVGEQARTLGDPRRLAQALTHLLFTAVKWTPNGGRVRISVDPGPVVVLTDVGVSGEPARLYEHVLNGALLGATPGGADAGLAAVKAILDAHHANVALCDTGPEGTALHVVFPPAG
jgi:signal transduction histidine kinase